MKCKKFQDIMITDYLDGEIDAEKKKLVEEHLAVCSHCREYKAAVTKSTVEPFRKAETINPSDSVWRRIKEKIEEDRPSLAPRVFYIPRPVFSLAVVIALALFLGILAKFYINKQEIAKVQSERQVDYFSYLFRGNGYISSREGVGYGTAIEEYFL